MFNNIELCEVAWVVLSKAPYVQSELFTLMSMKVMLSHVDVHI